MPIPSKVFLPQPFANNAGAPYKNTIPNTSGTSGVATYDQGFPPITMQEEVSGGIPPLGQDFNGILNALSTHIFAQQAGQLYNYSASVSTAIGGYPVGAMIESTDGATVWFNVLAGNTSDPDASGAGWVPMFNYGFTPKTGLTGGIVTLTRVEAKAAFIVLSGTLSSNLQVVLPATLASWLIINTTSGAFTTTVKTAGGSGAIVPQGGYVAPTGVYGDGTNIYPTVAPVNLPIDQAPTPLTIAQRTNNGYLLATYFNQNSGLENPTVGAVFVENSGADGFLRKISLINFETQLLLPNISGAVLNTQVPVGAVTQYAANILASAALTGVPTTPTATAGTNTTQVASTAFVQGLLASPAFTGTPTAPTAAPGTNTTQLATTAFVKASALKVAAGRQDGVGVLATGSVGVNSCTHTGNGIFTIDVTAAGFTQVPTVLVSGETILNSIYFSDHAGNTPTTIVIYSAYIGSGLANLPSNFVCIGV